MFILTLVAKFLGMIPGLAGIASSITQTVFDAKVKMYQAKTGADRDAAVQALRTSEVEKHEATERLKVVAGSWVLLSIVVGFAAPLILYWAKSVGYDKAICSMIWTAEEIAAAGRCSTDALKGDLASWANTIIGSLFVSSTSTVVASMWLNRKGA